MLRSHGDLIEDFQLLMHVVWHAFREQMHALQGEWLVTNRQTALFSVTVSMLPSTLQHLPDVVSSLFRR